MNKHPEILAKGKYDYTTLFDHLNQVMLASVVFAKHLGLDENIVRSGAILHDIGKASPIFQKRLSDDYK